MSITAEQDKSEGSVRAVARALDVLLAFRPGDNELLVAELLKRVHLSRPTLYRLLDTLVSKGFLVSEGEPQRFRLGPAVAHLAHAWTAGLNYSAIAQPMMRRLWEATSETVSLHVHDGMHRVCVAELPSPQPLSFKRGVGFREKLLLGASGRSILAWLDVDTKALMAYGAQNAAEAAKYLAQLEQIRARGYATSRDELIQGAVAIAAPFFDGSGGVIGSIGLFGPSVRLTDDVVEHYGSLLVEESRQLSAALGVPANRRAA
jgi:DNA-binding IclR family transcriptional regulator